MPAILTGALLPPSPPQANPSEQPTRRSRAVWGPPLLNTSQFAVMVDDNLNSLNSPSSVNETDCSEQSSAKEEHQTPAKLEEKSKAPPISPNGLNVIQFPSPCVDKDFFHVKQVKLSRVENNARLSWMASANDEDFSKQDTFKEDSTILCPDSPDESPNATSTENCKSSPKNDRQNSHNHSFEFSSDYSKILGSPMTPKNSEKVSPLNEHIKKIYKFFKIVFF